MKGFVFFISLLILSCNSQKEITNEEDVVKGLKENAEELIEEIEKKIEKDNSQEIKNAENKNPDIILLTEGTHGGFNDPKNLVIKNQKSLQEVYVKINMTRRPGFQIPEIDFEKEMVIALFMGEKNSGGYSTIVESVTETKNSLEILIKESKPEGIATTVICQPFYFCKVNRSDKKIVFKKVD